MIPQAFQTIILYTHFFHWKWIKYLVFIEVNLAEKIVPANLLAILLLIYDRQSFYCSSSVRSKPGLRYRLSGIPPWANDQQNHPTLQMWGNKGSMLSLSPSLSPQVLEIRHVSLLKVQLIASLYCKCMSCYCFNRMTLWNSWCLCQGKKKKKDINLDFPMWKSRGST